MKTGDLVSLQGPGFSSFGSIPRSGMAGSYDSCRYNFERKYGSTYMRFKIVKFIEPKSRAVVARGWGRGKRSC